MALEERRLQAVGRYRGMCALCGHPDARHRLMDAVTERRKLGESVNSLALDYGLDQYRLRRIIGEA